MTIGQIQAAENWMPLILAYNSGVTPQVSIALAMPAIANPRGRHARRRDSGSWRTLDEVKEAIALGSSSVMFDGRRCPSRECAATAGGSPGARGGHLGGG